MLSSKARKKRCCVAKTNVQTNLLGRRVVLTEENAAAAQRYLDQALSDQLPSYVQLHPDGGEVVAVFKDRDDTLTLTVSSPAGLLSIPANWLRILPEKD